MARFQFLLLARFHSTRFSMVEDCAALRGPGVSVAPGPSSQWSLANCSRKRYCTACSSHPWRGQASIPKNRVEPHIEETVVALAAGLRPRGHSQRTQQERHFISPAGVRCVWLRHNLENFRKRPKALEAKVAQGGLALTEDRVRALEKARQEKEAQRDRDHASGLSGRAGYLLCGRN